MKKRVFIGLLLFAAQFSFAQGLGIAVTNGAAKIFWPLTNYYSLIQTSTNLTVTNPWSDVGSASPLTVIFSGGAARLTNFSGSNIIFSQQVAVTPHFFRLNSPALIPAFGFSIFYDGLLEFTGSAPMTMNGVVHANGPIYTGTIGSSAQTFNGTITTGSTISSPANGGYTSFSLSGSVSFNASPPFITNVPSFVQSLGTNNAHTIVEIPPSNENVSSLLGWSRLYNQACVILIVTNPPASTNPTVTVILQTSFNGQLPGDDVTKVIRVLNNASQTFLSTNNLLRLPFLSLTTTFTDLREAATDMFVTQIDVGAYATWLATNVVAQTKFSGGAAPILYVADQRNIGTNKLAVVRLTRATKLPYNNGLGFTVATQNPLYVWGNYNTTINSNIYAATVGSTTNGAAVPAALIADAITILSPNWSDALSASVFASRTASSMTVNAAMLCGNVPSTGVTSTTFSGGVHNLTRFLENWAGATLTYNTSLVCLFSSQMATNQWRAQHNSNPSGYYDPPTRLWGFDQNFSNPNKLPPGTPVYGLP
jgi:hypothetical protein